MNSVVIKFYGELFIVNYLDTDTDDEVFIVRYYLMDETDYRFKSSIRYERLSPRKLKLFKSLRVIGYKQLL